MTALFDLSHQRVLITGASAGIGRATAIRLAASRAHLFLVARREEKLLEVKTQILALYPQTQVELIVGDINDSQIGTLIEQRTGKHIDVLINNAGLALGKDKVETSSLQDWEGMIQTNITANFKLVHLMLPWMLERKQGDIINICSVAGLYTYPGGAVYCATKHAVHAFTRVLREETCGKNIRVMQVSPGMVETEFSKVRFKGDEKKADLVYVDMTPLAADDIARMIQFMLESPRHVTIDEIITMPTDQGSPTTIVRKGMR